MVGGGLGFLVLGEFEADGFGTQGEGDAFGDAGLVVVAAVPQPEAQFAAQARAVGDGVEGAEERGQGGRRAKAAFGFGKEVVAAGLLTEAAEAEAVVVPGAGVVGVE